MALNQKEILNESNKSPFLDTPKIIDGFGSYYPEALSCAGEWYVIYQKPNKLFYNNGKYFVKVVKLEKGLEYGKGRHYAHMIFDNGRLKPFKHGISINNREEMNTKHPIVETEDGYMQYDENLNCSKLLGLPPGYYPTRWDQNGEGTMQLESKGNKNLPTTIYGIDKNYTLKPISGVPAGACIDSINGNVATLSFDDKALDGNNQYFYDRAKKAITPFVFKGLEGKSYKVDAFSTEKNVISIETDQKKFLYFYFAGKAEIEELIVSQVEGTIFELNKDSKIAGIYDTKSGLKENFYYFNNSMIVPFIGLSKGETIDYHGTYQFINAHSKVRALVVKKSDGHTECRTYEHSLIKPFEGLKKGWKVGDRIRESVNGDYYFLTIKIEGFSETHGLLSKDSQKILFYNDMLISGIAPKKRTLKVVTKEGPDCDVQLDENEREMFMKDRDPNYERPNSIPTTQKKTRRNLSKTLQSK